MIGQFSKCCGEGEVVTRKAGWKVVHEDKLGRRAASNARSVPQLQKAWARYLGSVNEVQVTSKGEEVSRCNLKHSTR